MLRRLGKLERRAANPWNQPELRHRIHFVERDSTSASGRRVAGVMLVGGGWTEGARSAAIEEDRTLAMSRAILWEGVSEGQQYHAPDRATGSA